MGKDMIQLIKGESGKWYWRIVASNKNVLLTSQTYSDKSAAQESASNYHRRHQSHLYEEVEE